MANNVFGEKLEPCSMQPVTGYYRDGCCNTNEHDLGTHTVCAIMTEEFLQFSSSRGNDLINPKPEYQFPGLKPGDRWCLCATRWKEAWMADKAPLVVLEATHEKTLDIIDLNILILYAYKSDKV
ncbi:MAG: DUF2237 family protein [Cyclobacteriaceae bacterium]